MKRRRTTRSRSRALTKKIKSVVYKQVETKTLGACDYIVLNQNSFYWTFLNNVPIYPGNAEADVRQFQTRFGQAYQLLGFRLKMLFTYDKADSLATINPMMIRVVLLETKGQQAADIPTPSTGFFILQDSTRIGWATSPGCATSFQGMSAAIDHKKYKVVKDYKFVLGNGRNSANGTALQPLDWWIPIKKRVNCNENEAGTLAQDRCYYLGFWMYDPSLIQQEGPVLDRTWQTSLCWKTYWKDP